MRSNTAAGSMKILILGLATLWHLGASIDQTPPPPVQAGASSEDNKCDGEMSDSSTCSAKAALSLLNLRTTRTRSTGSLLTDEEELFEQQLADVKESLHHRENGRPFKRIRCFKIRRPDGTTKRRCVPWKPRPKRKPPTTTTTTQNPTAVMQPWEDAGKDAGCYDEMGDYRGPVTTTTTTTTGPPPGMNPLLNTGKGADGKWIECEKSCMQQRPNGKWSSYGYCDWCGKGNACCKLNQPGAPTECNGVKEAAFYKPGEDYVMPYKLRSRKFCVYPVVSNISGYAQEVDEAFKGMIPPKVKPSEELGFRAAKMKFPGYARLPGMADHKAYFMVGKLEEKGRAQEELKHLPPDQRLLPEWKAKCPGLGNPAYAVPNTGPFPNKTFYISPYEMANGTELVMGLYCGSHITQDPSKITGKHAAEMAKKACDDMGSACGGFSLGVDPECCGPCISPHCGAPCNKVILLNSGPWAKEALTGNPLKEDYPIIKRPASSKGHYWYHGYTYVKQSLTGVPAAALCEGGFAAQAAANEPVMPDGWEGGEQVAEDGFGDEWES